MLVHNPQSCSSANWLVQVMDEGQVVQYGSPWELLGEKEGAFARLVEQTGEETAQFLHTAAQQRGPPPLQ
jgi:ABC-type multidrug transport system fused ATPase/permease subunit